MEDKNVIDVEYKEVKEEIYLTAPQLAQKIKDTDIRVRYWADVFGDLIGIEKLNGRKKYKESDIYKFAFIKDLIDNKNFKHDQVRVYISKHGFKYAEYDSGLLDTKDPLGFQALASALSIEVNEKMIQLGQEFLKNISNQLNENLLRQQQINLEMKAEIEASVDEIVSERLDTKLKEFKGYIDQRELAATKRDNDLIDTLRKGMEEKHKIAEEKKKKGFLGRLFKNKI